MSSDFHTHTLCSPDSSSTVEQVVGAAAERQLEAVAITDHAEIDIDSGRFGFVSPNCLSYSTYRSLVLDAAGRYKGQVKTLLGVEIGYNSKFENEIRAFLEANEFDVVIGSVHDAPALDWWAPSASDILLKHPELGVEALRWYFEEVERAASSGLFDIIAHIDIYERYVPSSLWPNPFEQPILRLAAQRAVEAIASHSRMEVNLSMVNREGRFAWSTLPFLEMYRGMGGKPPSTGSDAHRPNWVGLHVPEGEALARRAGFSSVATWLDVIRTG